MLTNTSQLMYLKNNNKMETNYVSSMNLGSNTELESTYIIVQVFTCIEQRFELLQRRHFHSIQGFFSTLATSSVNKMVQIIICTKDPNWQFNYKIKALNLHTRRYERLVLQNSFTILCRGTLICSVHDKQ